MAWQVPLVAGATHEVPTFGPEPARSTMDMFAWTGTEFPHTQQDNVMEVLYGPRPSQLTIEMVSSADEIEALYDIADGDADGRVTIFRGVGPDVVDPIGFSWTLDEAKAAWFGNRFYGGGRVVTAKVHLDDVVCLLTSRGESEILLTLAGLRRLAHKLGPLAVLVPLLRALTPG